MNNNAMPSKENKLQWPRWRKRSFRLVVLIFFIWYVFCLPSDPFTDPCSTVLQDRDGQLLGAIIADDGQWRFPASDSVPNKFKTCLLAFEDRNFYHHFGISIKGTFRAIKQNFSKGEVVSGGSTITMQVVRMMRKNPPRTYSEKLVEMLLATRMEWQYTKEEILNLYAANAPFGTNVVGLEAASWRYFGRSAHQLSWAESATLAVLPNAPGLIYPGKRSERLLAKRDRLLNFLHQEGIIDKPTWQLAISEPLPGKPFPLPRMAPHLLDFGVKKGLKGTTINSYIELTLQEKVNRLLNQHALRLRENQIFNGAVLITSVKTGEIIAYVGNTSFEEEEYSAKVNCANAARSTGSILKPMLYTKALENGIIMPEQLVTDIPVQYGSYAPRNFSGQFEGALPINRALSRSLNVPMVHLLHLYGVSRFHDDLKQYGLTTFKRPPSHYGLSLILGGGEARLTELSEVYTHWAQELKYGQNKAIQVIRNLERPSVSKPATAQSKASIFATFNALVDVNRPDEENNWRAFTSSQKIAWKTGTSFGFRDAWAIGVTPDYVVAVWIGNADGEGRPGLTGVSAAAPLLFDLFALLPRSKKWFREPKEGLVQLQVCHESGQKAGPYCPNVRWKAVPEPCNRTLNCAYHQLIHVNKQSGKRVDRDCETVHNIRSEARFVLPPVAEKYYRSNHPNYLPLPPWQESCLRNEGAQGVGIIYPRANSQIYVPLEIDGQAGKSIFEATLRQTEGKLFWHLDEQFLGETRDIHQLAVRPTQGKHLLTVIDEYGNRQSVRFEVMKKRDGR